MIGLNVPSAFTVRREGPSIVSVAELPTIYPILSRGHIWVAQPAVNFALSVISASIAITRRALIVAAVFLNVLVFAASAEHV
jgi:hypothetical protein